MLAQDGEVLLLCLAETVARVQDDVLHVKVAQLLHLLGEMDQHVVEIALDRHEDIRHLQAAHHTEDGGIVLEPVVCLRVHVIALFEGFVYDARDAAFRNIVDDVGSILFYDHTGHVGTIGVDGDRHVGLLASHDGEGVTQPAHLFLLTHLVGSRTRGESAHVDDLATLGNDLVGTVRDLLLRLLAAPREEAVRRAVEDAHHDRLPEGEQAALNI